MRRKDISLSGQRLAETDPIRRSFLASDMDFVDRPIPKLVFSALLLDSLFFEKLVGYWNLSEAIESTTVYNLASVMVIKPIIFTKPRQFQKT